MTRKRARPNVVVLYLDDKEKRELGNAAAGAGLSLGVYVRALVLTSVRRSGSSMRLEPVT